MFKVGIKHGIVQMNSNSSYRAAPVFVRYIAILAGVVNFLPHPNPPRTRSLGSKKFTNDARIAITKAQSEHYPQGMRRQPYLRKGATIPLSSQGDSRRLKPPGRFPRAG